MFGTETVPNLALRLKEIFLVYRIRLGYCFTPYQRLWLYNGAPLVAFYDTMGIRRTYSRLKPTGVVYRKIIVQINVFTVLCYKIESIQGKHVAFDSIG